MIVQAKFLCFDCRAESRVFPVRLREKGNLWNYKRGCKPRGWADDGDDSELCGLGPDGNFCSVEKAEISIIYGRCPACEQKRRASLPKFIRLITCSGCHRIFFQECEGEYGEWEETKKCKILNRMRSGCLLEKHLQCGNPVGSRWEKGEPIRL